MNDELNSSPPSMLTKAIKAVPAIKYAMGIGGIVAVIAIIVSFHIDLRLALIGVVVMLLLMTVLVIFAKLADQNPSTFRAPARVLTWFALILFMVAAIAIFTSVFWGYPLDWTSFIRGAPLPKSSVDENGERYAVNWDIGMLFGDHRTVLGGTWFRSGSGSGTDGALYPANIMLFVTITNRRNGPVLIKNYKVKMKTDREEFVRLNELSISGMIAYGGDHPNQLSKIEDTSNFLENVVKENEIKAFGTVRGWMFFQYPKDTGRRFQPTMTITIADFSGDPPFTTPPLEAREEKTKQPPGMLLGAPIDLSFLPIQWLNEAGE